MTVYEIYRASLPDIYFICQVVGKGLHKKLAGFYQIASIDE